MVEKTSKHNTSTVIAYMILVAGAIQRQYDASNTILHRLVGATGVMLLILTIIAYATILWVAVYGIRQNPRLRKAFAHDAKQKASVRDIPTLMQGLIVPVLLAINGFGILAVIKLVTNMLRPFLTEILAFCNRKFLNQFQD